MGNCTRHFAAGVNAFRRRDFKVSVDEFEQATRHDPENRQAFSFLGAAYAEQRMYNSAIGAFKRAAEMHPENPNVHYNLGQAYEVAGVPLQAWFQYRRALKINPRHCLAKSALISLNARLPQGRSKGAKRAV